MRRPIRVLYVVHGLPTGGTERLILECATGLDPTRFDACVIAGEDGPLGTELRARGVRVEILGQGLARLERLPRALERRRRLRRATAHADVVHTHHLGELLNAAMARFPRQPWRWVHTEHIRPDIEGLYKPSLLSIGKVLMRLPDALTGVAEAVTDYLIREVPAAKSRCRTIYNGIDLSRFRPIGDGRAKRTELGIPADAWIIGTVGSLRAQKNHIGLLEAFQRVAQTLGQAWLVVVGEGEMRHVLERRVRELGIEGRTRLLGSRLDVPQLLAAFDVYCLPSHFEGMPLSLLEAMAARLPVVATDVVGIKELVVNGETALLVPPGDVTMLTRALLRLAGDPILAARLASGGHEYVTITWRRELMLDRYARLYEELVGNRSHAGADGEES